jgi:hypothetical protein
MPRPDQPPLPRAGEEAEFGATAWLQRLATAVPAPSAPAPFEPPPSALAEPGLEDLGDEEDEQLADLNEGMDEVLFAPTDRPGEPLTEGMPFGPGSSFVPRPGESEEEFIERIATAIDASPTATAGAKDWIKRHQAGE